VMVAVLWIFRNAAPGRTQRRFRVAQTVSAAAMALGHGLQDAQKTMGVIVLALVAAGWHTGTEIPLWVKLAAAGAISLGTYSGGWRIMRTLGRKVIELDPARGFVAESVSAGVLYTTAFLFHAPISTTHTITSAIMGVGATKRASAVRWGVARSIGVAWVLTIPAAAVVAAVLFFVLHFLLACAAAGDGATSSVTQPRLALGAAADDRASRAAPTHRAPGAGIVPARHPTGPVVLVTWGVRPAASHVRHRLRTLYWLAENGRTVPS